MTVKLTLRYIIKKKKKKKKKKNILKVKMIIFKIHVDYLKLKQK